jgi:hypothetical protein
MHAPAPARIAATARKEMKVCMDIAIPRRPGPRKRKSYLFVFVIFSQKNLAAPEVDEAALASWHTVRARICAQHI